MSKLRGLSVCLFVCLFVCSFVCLFVCLFVFTWAAYPLLTRIIWGVLCPLVFQCLFKSVVLNFRRLWRYRAHPHGIC